MSEQPVEFRLERGIGLDRLIGPFEIEHERHQGLGDKAPAIGAKMARHIGAGTIGIGRQRGHA